MRLFQPAIITAVCTALLLSTSVAQACPFCSAPSLTLSEQLAQSDAAVLVHWVEGTKPEEKTAGSTVYEVRKVVNSTDKKLKKGERITLTRFRAGKEGDLFLLMGTQGATQIEWGSPLEVTEISFNYISQAPQPEAPPQQRLEYFLKFLEFPDSLISNDAYAEFANAPYKDITPLADKMPRDKIRKWVTSSDTPATRLGLYGLMIGLCGNDEDAKLIEKKIAEKTEDFRLGIDGIISGYLLLTGKDGLDMIDETKLKDKDIPFSETYAAMQALRFMWSYAEETIPKERLRQSMRLLLDRPELADLVIADLARWKDWSIQDRLLELYDADEYNVPSVKRAIVRYYLAGMKDTPGGDDADQPSHVIRAREILEKLREDDPKTVKQAERFFFQ